MTNLELDTAVVGDLPPSAKLVYLILRETGPCTQKDLVERTALAGRTVRYALDRLDDKDLIEERPCLTDARQSCYRLPPAREAHENR